MVINSVVGPYRKNGVRMATSSARVMLAFFASLVLFLVFAVSPSLAGFAEGRAAYKDEDYEVALEEFRKAAEQGHAGAQFYLGILYRRGRGVAPDFAEAVRWYRKAADQGHAKAQYSLGRMHQRGQGVDKDFAEAARWHRMGRGPG